ncbi:MAG TPA: hypothetical protein DCL44_01500 [Elusimicrobia bacterium]|nr:hypothetical protein [Elusimicrobiota bacterium]
MKKIKGALVITSLAFFASFAGALDVDFNQGVSVKDFIKSAKSAGYAPVPAVPAAKPQKDTAVKEWTIMVFMNGKNNLTNLTLNEINAMEMAGVPENVNLVVEAGRIPLKPSDFPDFLAVTGAPKKMPAQPLYLDKRPVKAAPARNWTGVRRYYIQKDNSLYKVTSPILEELKADMGDWQHLAEFGLWAKAKFPARHYMLIIWDHGNGWKSRDIGYTGKGISADFETGKEISGVELGQALAKMGGVDIYASDACLMQMVEVAYELKNSAFVIIGSEEQEPEDGWPYNYFLSRLQNLDLTAENIAEAAVRGFLQYYSEQKTGVTISALHTRDLSALKTLTDQWAALAINSGERALLYQAQKESKTFSNLESRDMIHFLTLAAAKTESRVLKEKSLELAGFISSNVVFANAPYGDSYKNANGLAFYMPYTVPDINYSNLAWAKDGKWYEFITWLQKSGGK